MDTDCLYLVFADKKLEDCVRPEMKAECQQQRSKCCTDCFTADAVGSFSPECAATGAKNCTSESLVFSNRSSGVRKCSVFVVKFTAATTNFLKKWNSAAKASLGENWSKSVLVLRKSIAKFLMKKFLLHLQTEVYEQRIIQLQLMDKLNDDYYTFIVKE